MPAPVLDLEKQLRTLEEYGVEFSLVGGVCAQMHGSAQLTTDLDIVPKRTPENLRRLADALKSLRAYNRTHPVNHLLPDAERMDTPGHHLFRTVAGDLDVLGSKWEGKGYEDLRPNTELFNGFSDTPLRILDLDTLIEVKRQAGRPKDQSAVLHLSAVRNTRQLRLKFHEEDVTEQ